jgi:hypothetical protein
MDPLGRAMLMFKNRGYFWRNPFQKDIHLSLIPFSDRTNLGQRNQNLPRSFKKTFVIFRSQLHRQFCLLGRFVQLPRLSGDVVMDNGDHGGGKRNGDNERKPGLKAGKSIVKSPPKNNHDVLPVERTEADN